MEKAQESMALFRRIAGQAQSVLGRKKHFYEKLRKSNKSWTDNFLENYTRVDTNIKQLRHDIAIALLDPEWIDLKIVTSHTRSDLIKYLELTNCKDPQFLLLRDGQNSSPLVEASIPTEAISAFRRIAPNQPSEEMLEFLKKPTPASLLGDGIRELSAKDFEGHLDQGSFTRRFLQGGPVTPATALHGAVPRQAAADLWEACATQDILLLHGSIGEGTSTALLQVAYYAIIAGRRVLQIGSAEALQTLPDHPLWNDRPVFIFDDAHRIAQLPSWLLNAFPGDPAPTLILGTQTRRRAEISSLFVSATRTIKEWRLPRITIGASKPFIDLIVASEAAPEGLSRDEIVRLFNDGLERPTGLSGLWPAQFQATRGALLDDRLRTLLSGLAPTARIISIVAFYGRLSMDTNGQFPPPDYGLLERTLKCLNLESTAESECLESLRGVGRLLDGELQNKFGSQDIEQRRDYTIELRHPALAESLFRHSFGSAKEVDQPPFDKWPYYVAAIKAVGAARSNSAAILAYGVLQQMHKATSYDARKEGILRDRLTSVIFPKVGDRILHAIEQAEATLGTSLTDGGWYSRRLNNLKAAVLLGRTQIASDDDKVRARERLDAALANAVAEADHEVLRFAARLAQDLNYTTADGDWRSLIELAESLEPDRDGGPKRATQRYVDLALNVRRPEGLPKLLEVFERARLTHGDWDFERLEVLHRLLNWVRREGDGKVHYLIPKDDPSEGLTSLRAIYQALWREMWGRAKRDSRFRVSLTNRRNAFVWTEFVISSVCGRTILRKMTVLGPGEL